MKIFMFVCCAMLSIVPVYARAEEGRMTGAEKYQAGNMVRILIIPGHDQKYSGAYWNGMSEQEINLKLAQKIRDELVRDPLLSVTVTRAETSESAQTGYIPEIQAYFDDNEVAINQFIKFHTESTKDALDSGDISLARQVPHHNASKPVAYQLYGVNKWATENDFDIILNVHFNDDTGHTPKTPGNFSGFVVYVPDENLPNHADARIIGEAIGARMKQTFSPSSMPLEAAKEDDNGVIPDFTLIALGSNRTLRIPSVLVEYSYIYEPQISKPLFDLSSYVMARATTRGLYDYLNGPQDLKNLLYSWGTAPLSKGAKVSPDVMALQFGLKELGLYPPSSAGKCPFTGNFGPCTLAAVKAFQKLHGLKPDGAVGPKTKEALNAIFSTGL